MISKYLDDNYTKFNHKCIDDFPKVIKDITGKELKLKISINEDNVKAKSNLYFAGDACDIIPSTSTMCSSSKTNSTPFAIGEESLIRQLNLLIVCRKQFSLMI